MTGKTILTLSEAAEMRAESEKDFAESRKCQRICGLLVAAACIEALVGGGIGVFSRDMMLCMPWFGVAMVCAGAALEMRLRASRSDQEGHDLMLDLENSLDADSWQKVMGYPHPWKTF